MSGTSKELNRVAIVAGQRTPFVKAGSKLRDYSFQEMGEHVCRALIDKSKVDPEEIDLSVFSTVLLDPRTPNWAREIAVSAGLPKTLYSYAVSNNCISGLVAATSAAQEIILGRVETAIAGGSESMSKPSLLYNQKGADVFLKLSRARSLPDKLKLLGSLRPKTFLPQMPSVAEPSTGLTMGEHMEITAKELKIEREIQDKIAFDSHQNALKARENGVFDDEIAPLGGVAEDGLIRADTTIEKLAKLRSVFDKSSTGTLSAGNSSALTDGASALLLMSEKKAKKLKLEVLAYIKDWEYSAISTDDGLLMAPAVAVPRLLKRQKMKFKDFQMIEVHEAFGAQVAANIKAWEEGLIEKKVGKLPRELLNQFGGSIALGHPFAATGGRIMTTMANQLKKNDWKQGLISICAAGAMAGAMILERD